VYNLVLVCTFDYSRCVVDHRGR